MKHAVRHIRFVGVVDANREQGSRLRDATVREWLQMPTGGAIAGEMQS